MIRQTISIFCASLLLMLSSAKAQEKPEVPQPNPADVESVDAIMAAVYDVISGGKGVERDWDRFLSLFYPGAKLIPTGASPDGSVGARFWTPEEYVDRAGAFLEINGFFEREIFRVQEGFGNIVHLFSTYESRNAAEDPDPFARGINSFQLLNTGDRWWVINIYWEAESETHPIPSKYLPGN